MRTIPAAMTWELVMRQPWGLVAGALAAPAFPALILAALNRDGGVDPQDESMLVMHVVLMQVTMFAFGMSVFAIQGPMRQLYHYPARTATLVAWRMAPAMALVAVESVLGTLALNAMFKLGWPLWGPAMFLAASMAAIQAAVWLTDRSAWVLVAMGAVAAAFGWWFKLRHGWMTGPPRHLWMEVTPGEVATMVAAALAAYGVAVLGVARNRRGEPPLSVGFVSWLTRVLDPAPAEGAPFGSARQAQAWFEWRRKGGVLPSIVGFGLIAWLSGWVCFSRRPDELVDGFVAAGGLLSIVAFITGMLLGNIGPDNGDFEMGHYLATRPLSDAEMARIVLRNAVNSVLAAWALWAGVFAAALVVLAICRALPPWPEEVKWWYLPATLVGLWISAGTAMTLSMMGRSKLFLQLLCAVIVGFFAVTVFGNFALSEDARKQLERAIAAGVGTALIFAVGSANLAARRRGIVELSTLIASACLWATMCAVIAMQISRNETPLLPGLMFLAGIWALAFLPMAAAPLALAWNRHR